MIAITGKAIADRKLKWSSGLIATPIKEAIDEAANTPESPRKSWQSWLDPRNMVATPTGSHWLAGGISKATDEIADSRYRPKENIAGDAANHGGEERNHDVVSAMAPSCSRARAS